MTGVFTGTRRKRRTLACKLGIVLPQRHSDPDVALSAASLAEEHGLDSVWVSDHLADRRGPLSNSGPWLDGWTVLAAIAEATDNICLGTLVLRVGARPAQLVSQMAATLADVAQRRVVIGLGIGDRSSRPEQAALGEQDVSLNARLSLLQEHVSAIRAQSSSVEILIGGMSERLLHAAANYADIWNVWGVEPSRLRHVGRRIMDLREGRPIEISWAGLWPGVHNAKGLIDAGAEHLMIAVGAVNLEGQIARVAALRAEAKTSN